MTSFLRRWLYLILGGALLMPFLLLMTVALGSSPSLLEGALGADPVIFLASLPLAAISGFFPQIRAIEVPVARALLGGRAQEIDPAGAGVRSRVALFWFLHLFLGGLVSAFTLAIPPAGVLLIADPFVGNLGWVIKPPWIAALGAWAPLLGLVLLAALVAMAAGVSKLLASLAPRLLGPSGADRIAALKRTAEQLAERNRLARELHDSVGHTLSIVMLQASAASEVFDSNPAFARKALANIEESARAAQAELDHVLGLLREAPRLRHLIEQAQQAGVDLGVTITGDETTIPPEVAHELQQIVREGLTNVIRHAGAVPVRLTLAVKDNEVQFTLVNPVSERSAARQTGGRGLLGIKERAEAVQGQAFSGVRGDEWQLSATLPFGHKS